ncbi:MAG: phosphate/phosphite/phosphonate ABC transporter substrate-binding protein [Gammaproteobacteria bacterium]|nr:phosphate/phosphite/phosphonate ABC transporter substrate-binding protein [Rhodocyclaceae bacterium]MBU3907660.1 phosphate/phosphite/phosphonate ABC transporter substrate-binding protein [Gammaproteobacteria bacterium]MBU3989205.1 phosphate/phosphite/phosphonate ABC transporter substrate-binding protein [Gammaproteobacteria bacterium]MBU4004306.1 phosphate/phosphite/phosphonate ABC transporter substrate-binding protein [Gammaproteobacteria bacterium]MBU4019715.1 phosphate/phosphite/phosphona
MQVRQLFMRLLLGALAVLLFSPLAAANHGELVFGVYPYLSPSQTVEQFAPLKTHLSKVLGRPVSLRSAPDFSKFVERTRAGEYDIIFTAPHMGRIAEKRDGYHPLAQTGYPIVVVVVTKNNSPVESLGALHNRSLAVGTQLSMTYQIMNQALGKTGLELGKNVQFIDTATFSNVLTAVLRGEADAGATGTLLWDSAPAAQRSQLREIYRSPPVPGFLLLGHPRLGAETLKQLQHALFGFAETPHGHTYFAKTQQIDFRPLDAATMKHIDPFVAVFEKP